MTRGATLLTEGVVWRKLVRYATPLVISSVLQAMYGMVDMIIAGNFIGPEGLSALNNSTQIMSLITKIIIGITTGGNILVGQYFGAGDEGNVKRTTVTLFSMGLILGVALAALFVAVAGPFLRLLGAPAYAEAKAYLEICALGIFFIVGYNCLAAALTAVGNSRQPMVCIAITSVVNVVLDLVLVAYCGMGTRGAAIATVAAQGISFVVCLIYVLRRRALFGLDLRRLRIHADKLGRIWKLGLPCALQMSIASISWLSVTYFINGYDLAASAGNGISIKIKDFSLLFIHAMVNGSTAMIAQNLGAGQYDRARQVMFTAMRLTVGTALVFIAVVEIFAPALVSIFTGDPETAAAAVRNLRIEIVSQLFYAVFMSVYAMAMGAGHTPVVTLSSFVNCIPVRLLLTVLFNRLFGLTGIYVACMIAPASSIPVMLVYYRSGRWRRSLVETRSA